MDLPVNESLTLADKIVLDNLRGVKPAAAQDDKTVLLLEELNNPSSPNFLPTVFTIFPEPPPLNRLWRAYLKWASGVVRRPTDLGELPFFLSQSSCKRLNLMLSMLMNPIGLFFLYLPQSS